LHATEPTAGWAGGAGARSASLQRRRALAAGNALQKNNETKCTVVRVMSDSKRSHDSTATRNEKARKCEKKRRTRKTAKDIRAKKKRREQKRD
jgi:hypothetical protein